MISFLMFFNGLLYVDFKQMFFLTPTGIKEFDSRSKMSTLKIVAVYLGSLGARW